MKRTPSHSSVNDSAVRLLPHFLDQGPGYLALRPLNMPVVGGCSGQEGLQRQVVNGVLYHGVLNPQMCYRWEVWEA